MKMSPVIRDSLVSAPGAVVAGVARELIAHKVNPSFAKVKVSNWAWAMNAATLGLGLLGKALQITTGRQDWGVASDGLYHTGLGYLSQDLTHTARVRFGKDTPTAQAPQRVVHAQASVRRAAPMWGGAEY